MKSKILLFSVLMVLLMAGNAFALGTNITIWDGMGGLAEDQEVEPNCVWNQAWDLEGFFLDVDSDGEKLLTMVGGFDFQSGYGGYQPGDIFIDVTGDALYGSNVPHLGGGNVVVNNVFGYDYVIDMDTKNVYKLTSGSTVTVYFGQNDESNPWIYDSGGELLGSVAMTYYSGLSDEDVGGLLGGTHYAVRVDDLGFLGNPDYFLAHFTYECGNDNLIGSIPDATTLVLLGSAMLGVAVIGRKKVFKRS